MSNLKKIAVILCVFLAFMLLATGCNNAAFDPGRSPGEREYDGYNPGDSEGSFNLSSSSDGKKLIKSADVRIACDDVDKAYQEIVTFLKANDGFEASLDSNYYDEYKEIDATLRIPAAQFDALIEKIKACGETNRVNKKEEDVSGDYADYKLRAEKKRDELENYKEILKQAKTIEETITVREKVDALILEIEQLESQMKTIDSRVDYSEVSLYIRETRQYGDINEWEPMSAASWGEKIANGFIGAFNVLLIILQGLVIVVAALLPFAILTGIVLFIVFFLLRMRKKRRAAMQNKNQQ